MGGSARGGLNSDGFAFRVDFQHFPSAPRQGQPIADDRLGNHAADRLGVSLDGVFLGVGESGVELEVVNNPFGSHADNQAVFLRALQMVKLHPVAQNLAEVILGQRSKGWQSQHLLRQGRRRQFTGRQQNAQGLLVEQTEGKLHRLDGFNPFFLQVELDDGDRLEQLPRQLFRQGLPAPVGWLSAQTNRISAGLPRRPDRPKRCKKLDTDPGASS